MTRALKCSALALAGVALFLSIELLVPRGREATARLMLTSQPCFPI
jgi:hypothetical protein